MSRNPSKDKEKDNARPSGVEMNWSSKRSRTGAYIRSQPNRDPTTATARNRGQTIAGPTRPAAPRPGSAAAASRDRDRDRPIATASIKLNAASKSKGNVNRKSTNKQSNAKATSPPPSRKTSLAGGKSNKSAKSKSSIKSKSGPTTPRSTSKNAANYYRSKSKGKSSASPRPSSRAGSTTTTAASPRSKSRSRGGSRSSGKNKNKRSSQQRGRSPKGSGPRNRRKTTKGVQKTKARKPEKKKVAPLSKKQKTFVTNVYSKVTGLVTGMENFFDDTLDRLKLDDTESTKIDVEEEQVEQEEEVAKKIEYQKTVIDKPEAETPKQELKRSTTLNSAGKLLNSSLKNLWTFMTITLQKPFQIMSSPETILYSADRMELFYIIFVIQIIFVSLVLGLFTASIFYMYFAKDNVLDIGNDECRKKNTFLNYVAKQLIRKYILEIYYYWIMLVYSVTSGFIMLYLAPEFAAYCKGWFLLVASTEIKIHYGVKRYLFVAYGLIVLRLSIIGFLFIMPALKFKWMPPAIYGTSSTIGIGVTQFLSFSKMSFLNNNNDGKPSIGLEHRYPIIGLIPIYLSSFYCEISLLLYRVSCLLLSNASQYHKVRLYHALNHESIHNEEFNTRLDFPHLYEDYTEINVQGKKMGIVFDLMLLIYYGSLLSKCLVCLTVMSFYQYRDPLKAHSWNSTVACEWDYYLENDDPRHMFLSHVIHFIVTLFDFILLTYPAIKASEDCLSVHGIIRRHGLLKCKSEKERNFIRSMWISGDLRRPMVISPGHYFDIDRVFITNTILLIFLYYVLVLQIKAELVRLGKREQKGAFFSNCSVEFNLTASKNCFIKAINI